MTDRWSQRRVPGRVRVRWGGVSDAVEAECADVADVLSEAAAKWFASNHSPDVFVMPVVIERDGKAMSDEEAEAYLLDQLAVKRASREIGRVAQSVPPENLEGTQC